jgi:hypothetical protein
MAAGVGEVIVIFFILPALFASFTSTWISPRSVSSRISSALSVILPILLAENHL